MAPPVVKTKTKTIRLGKRGAAGPHRAGRAYSKLGFDAEVKAMIERCVARCRFSDWAHMTALTGPVGTRTGEKCPMLLTEAAKTTIRKAISDGVYKDRTGEEPPLMPPSPDPEDYSMVRVFASLSLTHTLISQSGVHTAKTLGHSSSSVLAAEWESACRVPSIRPGALIGVRRSTIRTSFSIARIALLEPCR